MCIWRSEYNVICVISSLVIRDDILWNNHNVMFFVVECVCHVFKTHTGNQMILTNQMYDFIFSSVERLVPRRMRRQRYHPWKNSSKRKTAYLSTAKDYR